MAAPHLSPWTRCGSTVYFSGQLAFDENGGISGDVALQTSRTLQNIATSLKALNLRITDVVKATIWLREREDFQAFNNAFAAFFGEHRPARSTVISALVSPEARIEIEVVALDRDTD